MNEPAPTFKYGDVVIDVRIGEPETVVASAIDSDGTEIVFLRGLNGDHSCHHAKYFTLKDKSI